MRLIVELVATYAAMAAGRALDVALDARDLPGEEDVSVRFQPEGRFEQGR